MRSALRRIEDGRLTPEAKDRPPLQGFHTVPLGKPWTSAAPDRLVLRREARGWLRLRLSTPMTISGPSRASLPGCGRGRLLGSPSSRHRVSRSPLAGTRSPVATTATSWPGMPLPARRWATSTTRAATARSRSAWSRSSPRYRRRGAAAELSRRSKQLDSRVHHSGSLTQDGQEWSRIVGLDRRLRCHLLLTLCYLSSPEGSGIGFTTRRSASELPR